MRGNIFVKWLERGQRRYYMSKRSGIFESFDKLRTRTFENCIETFENYMETFEKCMKIFENYIETFENIGRY